MKIMVTWQMYPGELHETLGKFTAMTQKDEEAAMGADVKLIGRWHDVARGRGVAVFETNNAEAISNYALNWNGVMDLDVSIVLDDEETRAVGRSRAG
ncbi:MAG: DUF3303 family protein [Candidatus Latescibacterota bacterium]|nr:MAG: DUF3303 family protein [Candidatus Latescibacterota bacterium]